MKKILKLSVLPLLLPLTCCEDNTNYERNLIFTEFCCGNLVSDRAVEIYNLSESEVDLSKYSIAIYRHGSEKPSETIKLDGKLASKKTYVIAYSDSNESFKNKANLITSDLMNNGSYSMSILYKNKYVVDVLGDIGYNFDIAEYSDLVRKAEYFSPRDKYVEYEWIRYPIATLSNLGNVNCVDEQTLLKGPRLTQKDLDTPFCESSVMGNGGTIKAPLSYSIDGDTSKINFGYEYEEYGVSGNLSVRYFGINTPEIAHGQSDHADAYGNEARDYTERLVESAKSIVIQSIKDYSLHETYGRVLGYVWISDKINPTPEDYELLSYKVVKEGLAKVGFITRGDEYINKMTYKGISYVEYLYDAQNYAKLMKLNIHSEK